MAEFTDPEAQRAYDEIMRVIEADRKTITETKDGLRTIPELKEMQDKMEADFTKRVDELEAKLNRPKIETSEEKFEAGKKALDNYLRHGINDNPSGETKTNMTVGTTTDGGYTTTPEMADFIAQAIYATSPVRQISTVVQSSTNQLLVPYADDSLGAAWTAETDSRTAGALNTWSQAAIIGCEEYAIVGVSNRLLMDSEFDLTTFISNQVASKFAQLEGTAFISGTGTNQPIGITSTAGGITASSAAATGALTYTDLVTFIPTLKSDYFPTATMLMSATVFFRNILGLKDDQSRPLFIGPVGEPNGPAFSVLGFPVRFCPDMSSTMTTGHKLIALGDFKRGYCIADHPTLDVIRDQVTSKGNTLYFFQKRVGGAVISTDAIKILKLA
jgi:HK97 family phage major capsid protein